MAIKYDSAGSLPCTIRYRKHSLLQSFFSFLFLFMSLLDDLLKKEVWENFRADKMVRGQLNKKELEELDSFIMEERYLIFTDDYEFSYPEKIILSKMGSNKKRTVYSYNSDETWALKLLGQLLYKYDDKLADNCYSFRKGKTAKGAIEDIKHIDNLNECYVFKTDIHDYFNSMDTDLLMEKAREVITDDNKLVEFMEKLLRQDKCVYEGEIISEKRGAMAGVPLASFWADIYLLDVDNYFIEENIPYFRYSDDMIIFVNNESEVEYYKDQLNKLLNEHKLTVNESKTVITQPHEPWEFLGFRYSNGKIDLSETTIKKAKGKIKRKAHKLYMWRKRNNRSFERAAQNMIRSFDYLFYDLTGKNNFTWTRFYFPVITVTDGLHEIDEYMVRYLRYLKTGKHNNSNYEVSYEELKKLGYTPLVSEYYNWKEDNRKLNQQK